MRRIAAVLIACFALWLGGASTAQAQTDPWVLCDTCTTSSQYGYAAMQKHGTRGPEGYYGVVNTVTGNFMWVGVTYTPPGTDPWRVGAPTPLGTAISRGPSMSAGGPSAHFQNLGTSNVVAPSGVDLNRAMATAAAAGQSAITMTPSAGEQAQIKDVVKMGKTQFTVVAAPGSAFSSYNAIRNSWENGGTLEISLALWAGAQATFPNWQLGNTNQTLVKQLLAAIGLASGKGLVGCMIFLNGDAACYQLNPMDPNAARYLDGTAVDAAGNPIATPPDNFTIPNSGGGGVKVVPNSPTPGQSTYKPIGTGSEVWIICGGVAGGTRHCYIEVF